MDAIVRAEFQRKDEAILAIQNNLEAQIRTINSWVKQEELSRTQLDVNLRMEQSKANETIRSELEGFKHQQESVNEKLTEMIQMETDA